MNVWRQGDVLFIPVTDPAVIARVQKESRARKSRLIRRGEHGGLHLLEKKPDARLLQAVSLSGGRTRTLYVEVGSEAKVLHGEHNPLLLGTPGLYEVRIQRELGMSGTRQVLD